MSFIPGKLKPRIKPRIGARAVGPVEGSDLLKNRADDQSLYLETSVQPQDPDPPYIGETGTQQEHLTQTSDETKSDTKCSIPIRSKAPAPILGGLGGQTKNSDLAKSLANADGDSKNVIEEDVVHHSLSIKTNTERASSGFAEDKSLESTTEEVQIEIVSGDALVKGNSCDADKEPTELPTATETSLDSADGGQTSPTISSVKEPVSKSKPTNTRPIGLKFPKPNLKKLARPPIANSTEVEQTAAPSDAAPKPIDGPVLAQTGDQELSCLVSYPAQPSATNSFAETLSHAANPFGGAGSDTNAEGPITNSADSVISGEASKKLIFMDKSSPVSYVSKDSSVESVSASSQIMVDVQQQDSNSGSDKNEKSDTSDRSVFKKPPKIFKRAPILKSDRVKTRADTPKTMVSSSTDDIKIVNIIGVVATPQENADAENETSASIPVIDTTIDRHLISTSPLSDVNDNTKNAPSKDSEKMEISGSNPQVPLKPTGAPKATPPLSKTGKSTKGEAEDVKVLFAISAVDYLKRHDHALGDSILRRLIIGDKNMENRSRKGTMCSTCNPQTLKKCLSSLWSFDKYELQTIIKKAAERQKAPSVSYAGLPGKTLFKPSLGRQRAPTLAASTYGKMSFEVKERLAKQYGPNPPQLNKLRMLDLIFYNPSDNPMSQPPKKSDANLKSESDSDGRSESQKAELKKGFDSDSDPDDPSEEKDIKASSDGSATTSYPNVPVPQVRIGDEGQIILAPESLVMKKKEPEVMNSPVVEEFSFADSNSKKASLDRTSWSFEETVQFYKALHSMGTDFTMMTELFPKRTRANLKSKFKREERRNPALIDKVLLAQGQTLNFTDVEKDLTADKTLRRLAMSFQSTSGKVSQKKSWAKAGLKNPGGGPNLSSLAANILEKAPKTEQKVQSTNSKNSGENSTASSSDATDSNEDAIFKRPSNIRPPRKRKPVTTILNLPEKRKKVESAGGKGSKETSDTEEDGVFKKPRIPKKRKLPQSSSSKRSNSPGPTQHLLSINLVDEEEDSDTDDSASLDGADEECFIIKTDVKGHNYSYSRSVKVNFADPEVPIDVNETIEHDRPETPMSDSMSEADTDSEVGEEVEVVSIDVNEIASYLEKTGAVIIESDVMAEESLPIMDDANPDDPLATENAEDSVPNTNDGVAEDPLRITDAEDSVPNTNGGVSEDLVYITDAQDSVPNTNPQAISDDVVVE